MLLITALYLCQVAQEVCARFTASCLLSLDCVRICQNGGTLNPGACTCKCDDGFSGPSCESECIVSCLGISVSYDFCDVVQVINFHHTRYLGLSDDDLGNVRSPHIYMTYVLGEIRHSSSSFIYIFNLYNNRRQSQCLHSGTEQLQWRKLENMTMITQEVHARLIALYLLFSVCVRVCENGGTLNPEACTCQCNGSFSGPSCESKCIVAYFWRFSVAIRIPYYLNLIMERYLHICNSTQTKIAD